MTEALFALEDLHENERTVDTRTYEKDWCWQYQIRMNNTDTDLAEAGFTRQYVDALSVVDFTFEPLFSRVQRRQATNFIRRHEWLGKMTLYTTHYFGAYHRNRLAGVLCFAMPNAFSKLLGEKTKDMERLIARGACISWSPKNLGSAFLMWAIKWMVDNTRYRLFTAYSDPLAKELGTIYQACNFYYLGKNSGRKLAYINPRTSKIVSDRFFRARSAYRQYAKDAGIEWEREWVSGSTINWDSMPAHVQKELRQRSRDAQANAESVGVVPKHKYALVLGRDKRETKQLKKIFESMNATHPYPKERGQ